MRLMMHVTGLMAMALPVAAQMQDVDVTVGVGAAVGHAYVGGSDYEVTPMPLIDVRQRNGGWFVGTRDGVGYGVQGEQGWKASAALVYVPGRDADDDDRLRGMGDIDAAAGVKLSGSVPVVGELSANGSVTQELGGTDGWRATVGVQHPLYTCEATRVSAGLDTTYLSDDAMQGWYGVDAGQAARSGLRRFDADGGFADVTARVNATHALTANWSVNGGVSLAVPVGDAADSPLNQNDVSPGLRLGVAYKF